MATTETIGERGRNKQFQAVLPVLKDNGSTAGMGRHTAAHILSEGRKPLSVSEIVLRRTDAAVPPPIEQPPVDTLPKRVHLVSMHPALLEQPPQPHIREPYAPSLPPPRRRRPTGAATKESEVSEKTRPEPHTVKPIESHAKPKRRKGRTIAVATAAIVAAVALGGGGFALFNDKKAPSASKQQSIELQVPTPALPPELPRKPAVQLTENNIISNEASNQWNASANKIETILNHNSNAITNIVAKIGAYDSLATSPDPDAAQAGDTFTSLTKGAIQLVDQLQQPLKPNASQDEQDAAQLILKLNSLNPMDTKQFVERYGSDILALKQKLLSILTAQETTPASYQTPKQAKKTTVFAGMFDKTTSIFKRTAQQTSYAT